MDEQNLRTLDLRRHNITPGTWFGLSFRKAYCWRWGRSGMRSCLPSSWKKKPDSYSHAKIALFPQLKSWVWVITPGSKESLSYSLWQEWWQIPPHLLQVENVQKKLCKELSEASGEETVLSLDIGQWKTIVGHCTRLVSVARPVAPWDGGADNANCGSLPDVNIRKLNLTMKSCACVWFGFTFWFCCLCPEPDEARTQTQAASFSYVPGPMTLSCQTRHIFLQSLLLPSCCLPVSTGRTSRRHEEKGMSCPKIDWFPPDVASICNLLAFFSLSS